MIGMTFIKFNKLIMYNDILTCEYTTKNFSVSIFNFLNKE